jgi:hypothetical protein
MARIAVASTRLPSRESPAWSGKASTRRAGRIKPARAIIVPRPIFADPDFTAIMHRFYTSVFVKFQFPSIKFQINSKSQASISKHHAGARQETQIPNTNTPKRYDRFASNNTYPFFSLESLIIDYCLLFGVLVIGICL